MSESLKQWFEHQNTRACVPHTPYTLILKFVPSAGGVCGTATHAVGGDAGYGLLPFIGYNRKKVSAAIAVKTTLFHSVILGMIL